MNSAELVAKVKTLMPKVEEASAKGFTNEAAMQLLYQLESSVDALLVMATSEFWAAGKREAR